MRETRAPLVSVVLPVLNEARDIGRLLEELFDQKPPPGGFEVLVVDGGSTDETRAIVRTFLKREPEVRLLDNPRKRSSSGRNVGVREARGLYVMFLDGHCALPRMDYLNRMVEIFQDTQAECLCRPQSLGHLAQGTWSEAIAAARHSFLGHKAGSDIYRNSPGFTDPRSAGAAYQREAIEQLGGYDERFDACEDVEFNHRLAKAGLRSFLHPDLRVDYRPRADLWGFFGQMARYGRGRARLMARHPSTIPWALVMPTLLILSVLGLGLISGPFLAASLFALMGLLWVGVVLAESLRLGGLSLNVLRIFCAFVAIHWGLLWGFWIGLTQLWKFRRPTEEVGLRFE